MISIQKLCGGEYEIIVTDSKKTSNLIIGEEDYETLKGLMKHPENFCNCAREQNMLIACPVHNSKKIELLNLHVMNPATTTIIQKINEIINRLNS